MKLTRRQLQKLLLKEMKLLTESGNPAAVPEDFMGTADKSGKAVQTVVGKNIPHKEVQSAIDKVTDPYTKQALQSIYDHFAYAVDQLVRGIPE